MQWVFLAELSIPWSCYEMLQWCVSDGSDNTSNENTVMNDVHGVIYSSVWNKWVESYLCALKNRYVASVRIVIFLGQQKTTLFCLHCVGKVLITSNLIAVRHSLGNISLTFWFICESAFYIDLNQYFGTHFGQHVWYQYRHEHHQDKFYYVLACQCQNSTHISWNWDITCTVRSIKHDDVMTWNHFPHQWHIVGNPPVTGSPHKRPVIRGFLCFFVATCSRWINGGVACNLKPITIMRRHWNEYLVINRDDFNTFWPSDAIWRQKSGSKLVHIMACCLTAPNHYLNHWWLIISKVLCIKLKVISQEILKISLRAMGFRIINLRLQPRCSGVRHFAFHPYCLDILQYTKIIMHTARALLCFMVVMYKPASVQVMAWHQTGNKPLSEPMMA